MNKAKKQTRQRKIKLCKQFCLAMIVALFFTHSNVFATDYHVSVNGSDSNSGTKLKPFRTISKASEVAMPGDEIIVHEGIYRERINPPRGGSSDAKRIIYRAAKGEKVAIKGSEEVKGWKKLKKDTWLLSLPNTFFGDFNPYSDVIAGDWFRDNGRTHHTGAVYLNGHWLDEAAERDEVFQHSGEPALWFAEVNDQETTIWAQFPEVNPNVELVEINVRQTVFYPEKEGINYITVRGFKLEHAATPWAPPSAEQVGLIGTHWSKGWIIEENEISYAICVGVTLGKHGDEFDNKAGDSAEGYVGTIYRGLDYGWSKENIGSHIVRNNHIHHCEQAGIVGSLGAVFSEISGNEINDIHVKRHFSGFEMGAIKIHGAIDMLVSNNYVHHCWRGIWLDWMTQGARVNGNLLHDNNTTQDLFIEVNHGPLLVDNNIMLSACAVRDLSQGSAFAHNLFLGKNIPETNSRETPYHKAHSTEVVELKVIKPGDDRYYNNIFLSFNDEVPWPERSGKKKEGNFFGLGAYDPITFPMVADGNVYADQARAYKAGEQEIEDPGFKTGVELIERKDGIYLKIKMDKQWLNGQRKLVTTSLLGIAVNPEQPFTQPDGSPYMLDTDFLGEIRTVLNPAPGPFSWIEDGWVTIKVWDRNPK